MTARKHTTKSDSGSPSPGEPEYLVVGMLRRPHGLQGEMLMDVVTDFPERLKSGLTVYVGEQRLPLTIASCRSQLHALLIRFEGISTPEAVGQYRRQPVCVTAADRPSLHKGQYYHHELLGCVVQDERGSRLGSLVEILQTGANDVYVIHDDSGQETLLPAIDSVVMEIDPENHVIRVRVPKGTVVEKPAAREIAKARRRAKADQTRHG